MTAPGTPEAQHVLYRHWDKDGQLLYVGMTNNPPRRLTSHRAKAEWWAQVSWTSYQKFSSRPALKAGETRAIKTENPRWNIQERVRDSSLRPGAEKYLPIPVGPADLSLRLIHPLSTEFLVYGGKTRRRAQEWALAKRVYLLEYGRCAHDMYLTLCPNMIGNGCNPGADHTQMWVPAPEADQPERFSDSDPPFILTQPHADRAEYVHTAVNIDWDSKEFFDAAYPLNDAKLPGELVTYATAHGLDATTFFSDAWYNPGNCVPIRLTPRVQTPLHAEALSLMCAYRDEWPVSSEVTA
jgi:hypothetical protein